jgi:hypothetical protein
MNAAECWRKTPQCASNKSKLARSSATPTTIFIRDDLQLWGLPSSWVVQNLHLTQPQPLIKPILAGKSLNWAIASTQSLTLRWLPLFPHLRQLAAQLLHPHRPRMSSLRRYLYHAEHIGGLK